MTIKVRLTELEDPDKTFRVRVCVAVRHAKIVGGEPLVSPTSVEGKCDECDEPIFIDTAQPLPPAPPGVTFAGDVNLCINCTALHSMLQNEPMQWLGDTP